MDFLKKRARSGTGMFQAVRNRKGKRMEDDSHGEKKAAGLVLAGWIAENSRRIEKFFIIALILSAICIPFVNVNYDLTEYLPDYVDSKQGIDRME